MNTRHLAVAVAASLLLGCGGPQDPATEDLTAEEHEDQAAAEERLAQERAAEYDPDARMRVGSVNPDSPVFYGPEVYNPTEVHLDAAREHREHAEAHRTVADQLRVYAQQECAEFPADTRASCPLLLGLETVENIDGGVRMHFASQLDLRPVVDHIRCHIAFAAAEGREGIEHCALYVHGAQVRVEGNSVILTTTVPGNVEELRRRVAVQLQ